MGDLAPPPRERDPGRFSPLFVLAPARSFTSVIATMIGQHPELVGLPELKLFGYRTIRELEASLPDYWRDRGFTHRSPGLVRAIAEFQFGGQTSARLAAARAWLSERARWSGADVLDVLLERLAPRAAVEKSPETVNDGAALRRLARAYPNARYLHLTRHPSTTAASMERHAASTLGDRAPGLDPTSSLEHWREVHERILAFTASLPPGRTMRMRAEDALNDPKASMRAVAQWLGVRADDEAIGAMLHPEASPFARFAARSSGVIGGHDHGFLRDPRLRPAALPSLFDMPPDWSGEVRGFRRAARLAERLGYPAALSSQPQDRALSAELLRRASIDRSARLAYAGDPADMARIMAIDAGNSAWLEAVIAQGGWPERDRVGEAAAHSAWLIAQHADARPELQRRFHEAMKEAVARGQASQADFARLTDRVLLAAGQPQEYGTQVVAHAGRYEPANLRAPRLVDKRRAAVGLEPLKVEIERMQAHRAPLAAVRCACPSCRETLAVAPPAPGRTTRWQCPNCGATGNVRARVGPRAASQQMAR